MAIIYVNSEATGTRDGTAMNRGYLNIVTACNSGSIGDTILVSSNHYATYSNNVVYYGKNGQEIISVNPTTYVYESGASEVMTAYKCDFWTTSDNQLLSFNGIYFEYNWSATLAYNYGKGKWFFNECTFNSANASSPNYWTSLNGSEINFNECVFDFNNLTTLPFLVLAGSADLHFRGCEWQNVQDVGIRFVSFGSNRSMLNLTVEDSDLSNFEELFTDDGDDTDTVAEVVLRRCLVKNGVTLMSTPTKCLNSLVLEYCSETGLSATPLGIYKGVYANGEANFDTTVYRYGSDGENNLSIKLDSNATCSNLFPLKTPRPLGKWHKADGSKPLYLYFVSDDANLTDRDVSINVSYNNHGSSAAGTFISTLAKYGNQTGAGSSTYLKSAYLSQWNGAGFNTAYRFEIPNVNPQEPGPVSVDFYLGKASTTVWVCPYMELG